VVARQGVAAKKERIKMNIEFFPVQIAILLLGACFGWHLRGLIRLWRVRRDERVWKQSRQFLPSSTSKN
jgi:hypothetical protein